LLLAIRVHRPVQHTRAIYAATLGVVVPHNTAASQALELAVAPLAVAAAMNPSS